MRAIAYAVIGALSLATAGAAAADDMSNSKGMSAAPVAKHGQGTGVIKAIDAKAGTLTIQHGPIPAGDDDDVQGQACFPAPTFEDWPDHRL